MCPEIESFFGSSLKNINKLIGFLLLHLAGAEAYLLVGQHAERDQTCLRYTLVAHWGFCLDLGFVIQCRFNGYIERIVEYSCTMAIFGLLSRKYRATQKKP